MLTHQRVAVLVPAVVPELLAVIEVMARTVLSHRPGLELRHQVTDRVDVEDFFVVALADVLLCRSTGQGLSVRRPPSACRSTFSSGEAAGASVKAGRWPRSRGEAP